MERDIEINGDVAVITVQCNHLDVTNQVDFRHNITSIVSDYPKVVFDIGNLKFIDSSGIGIILSTVRLARASGGDLKICSVSDAVKSVFELVRMQRLLDIYETCNDAIESFSKEA